MAVSKETVKLIQGGSLLAFDLVASVTEIVEAMHADISRHQMPWSENRSEHTTGITGFTYRTIRSVNNTVRLGVKTLLPIVKIPSEDEQSELADHMAAALNGLVGDHLDETDNPIAFTMQFRHQDQSLTLETEQITRQVANPSSKIVVLIHGLCMSDAQWQRNGVSHADGLENDLNYTPLYLRYNSGKHISQNGRELAECLEKLLESWPVDVKEISLVTHSMGGLVARSACHYGAQSKWMSKMRKVVFLGTPHHGAPLERKGNWLETLWGVIPYSAALARLGMVRSSGITDLRYGSIVDEDWQGFDRFKRREGPEHVIPLPRSVKCYAAASTIGLDRGDVQDKLLGDGLVPVSSALGEHSKPGMSLNIAKENQAITYVMNHFDLLYRPEIHEQVRKWMAE